MFGKLHDASTRLIYGREKTTPKMNFYATVDKDMAGHEVKMSDFAGNVLLVVNVASKWGLTKMNYQQLPQLYDEYSSRGFKVLAFPCNQFAGQEPGTHEEILEFVKQYDTNMADKLLFFEKADVNGAKARETFSFLKKETPNSDGTADIRWNFGKLS
jgi:glutathione peroxidase